MRPGPLHPDRVPLSMALTYLCHAAQISEKQLYEAEKQFKIYEAMINAMDEEVGMRLGPEGGQGPWGHGPRAEQASMTAELLPAPPCACLLPRLHGPYPGPLLLLRRSGPTQMCWPSPPPGGGAWRRCVGQRPGHVRSA